MSNCELTCQQAHGHACVVFLQSNVVNVVKNYKTMFTSLYSEQHSGLINSLNTLYSDSNTHIASKR